MSMSGSQKPHMICDDFMMSLTMCTIAFSQRGLQAAAVKMTGGFLNPTACGRWASRSSARTLSQGAAHVPR